MTASIAIIEPLTAQQATVLIADIKTDWQRGVDYFQSARQKLLEFDQRRGWEALGYRSLGAAAEVFGWSRQHVYRLRSAASVEALLLGDAPELSLIGDSEAPTLPLVGNAALKFAGLPTPEAQRTAHRKAQQLAQAEGADRVTERHAAIAAETVRTEAQAQAVPYPLLQYMVARGEVTPAWALDAAAQLDRLNGTAGAALELVAAGLGKADARLIGAVGQDFKRLYTTNPSRTLQTILASGTVANTPYERATLTDYSRAKAEAQAQRMAEEEEERRRKLEAAGVKSVTAHIVTVYRGDPVRTLAALRQVLPEAELLELLAMLMEVEAA